MSRVMVAITALGLSLSAPAAAQMVPASTEAETAEVGVVDIERVPSRQVKDPMQAPRAHRETSGAARSKHLVWIPGYWDLLGKKNAAGQPGWLWVPGRWARPPAPGLHWSAGHWGFRNGWATWIPAHWRR